MSLRLAAFISVVPTGLISMKFCIADFNEELFLQSKVFKNPCIKTSVGFIVADDIK
jgi:hypothetical protein